MMNVQERESQCCHCQQDRAILTTWMKCQTHICLEFLSQDVPNTDSLCVLCVLCVQIRKRAFLLWDRNRTRGVCDQIRNGDVLISVADAAGLLSP